MDQSQEMTSLEQNGSEYDREVEGEKPTSRIWLAFRIVLIFAAFLGIDVLMQQRFESMEWIFFILLSLIVAQLTLICIWGTLVEGTFWVRIPWTLLLLVISWAALVYGLQLEQQSVGAADVVKIGAFWFFGFLVSFIPLKIAAWLFGWRITQAKALTPSSNRYAIIDMMIGTAILALAISIGRMLIDGDLPTWSQVYLASGLRRYEQFFALTVFSVVSLIVKLPCIWVALATEKAKLFSRSMLWIFLAGMMGLAEFVLLCVVLGPPKSRLVEVCLAITAGHMAMAAAMIGVLSMLRWDGYRISRIVRG